MYASLSLINIAKCLSIVISHCEPVMCWALNSIFFLDYLISFHQDPVIEATPILVFQTRKQRLREIWKFAKSPSRLVCGGAGRVPDLVGFRPFPSEAQESRDEPSSHQPVSSCNWPTTLGPWHLLYLCLQGCPPQTLSPGLASVA